MRVLTSIELPNLIQHNTAADYIPHTSLRPMLHVALVTNIGLTAKVLSHKVRELNLQSFARAWENTSTCREGETAETCVVVLVWSVRRSPSCLLCLVAADHCMSKMLYVKNSVHRQHFCDVHTCGGPNKCHRKESHVNRAAKNDIHDNKIVKQYLSQIRCWKNIKHEGMLYLLRVMHSIY
jgi:hypothetical protein